MNTQGIEIAKVVQAGSNQYEKIKIPVSSNEIDFDHYGIMLSIKEYYKYLKNYCFIWRFSSATFLYFCVGEFNFRSKKYPFGISKVEFLTKNSTIMLILPAPGRYFDRSENF